MSITSEEINFLVYRYLQESGFSHSAFTFFNESTIPRSNINGANVPPGSLISLLQRGLQYKEMETHLNEDGSEIKCNVPFSLVNPHVCKIKDDNDDEDMSDSMDENDMISDNKTAILKGHTKEVYVCAWNGKKDILASGSADNSARIWRIPNNLNRKIQANVLPHRSPSGIISSDGEEVTILDWDPTSKYLATGALDGVARVWTMKGVLKQTLVQHKGPIFSLKWNTDGKYLLSGSADNSAIVWDPFSGEMKQQFNFHTASTLDVDWRDNSCFASCSTDRTIKVCEIGINQPVKQFEGHQNDVNAIKWCPGGKLLASCSDDCTAKIWSLDSNEPLQDLNEHEKELYTIKWNPCDIGSGLLLASASFDSTVKLWNVEVGKCLHNLTKHKDPVYSINFSPDGKYLASGSFDGYVHIWSVSSGELVKSYHGDGGIFEVNWNSKGDRIAACFDTNNIVVIDFRT